MSDNASALDPKLPKGGSEASAGTGSRANDAAPSTPVAQQLLAYWRSKLRGRKAPRREDILPEELGGLLPWVILVEVVGAPPKLRVRLAGTGVVREYGVEMTGKFLDDLDMGGMRNRSLEDHWRAVRECCPVWGSFDFQKQDGRWVSYERITLPLSADGKSVNMLLCGARMHGAGAQAQPVHFLSAARSVGAKWPG
jgi:hypothetical protein